MTASLNSPKDLRPVSGINNEPCRYGAGFIIEEYNLCDDLARAVQHLALSGRKKSFSPDPDLLKAEWYLQCLRQRQPIFTCLNDFLDVTLELSIEAIIQVWDLSGFVAQVLRHILESRLPESRLIYEQALLKTKLPLSKLRCSSKNLMPLSQALVCLQEAIGQEATQGNHD